jgi:hypothetical protein
MVDQRISFVKQPTRQPDIFVGDVGGRNSIQFSDGNSVRKNERLGQGCGLLDQVGETGSIA